MKKLKIWQQGLLHGTLLFLIVEFQDIQEYWDRLRKSGHYLFNSDGTPVTPWQIFVNGNYYNAVFLAIFLLAFLTEINYHLFFKKRKYKNYLPALIISAFFIEVALYCWTSLVNSVPQEWRHLRIFVFGVYIFFYALIRDFIRVQTGKKNRAIQRKDAEIKVLKAQVNPHFFFNTLNTIYGTALQENAPRTAKCIEQLSGIMRYTITGSGHDLTPLSEEVNFIEDYLQLQRLRIPERENIRIETDISVDDPSVKIAPLLLLPFIENAFKYGISTEHPCKVKIQLDVKDKALHFLAENTRFPGKNKPEGLGTGIENVRQRLDLIYPGRHQFSYGPEGPDFKVVLTLNLD